MSAMVIGERAGRGAFSCRSNMNFTELRRK
jgi:hypothetical protein